MQSAAFVRLNLTLTQSSQILQVDIALLAVMFSGECCQACVTPINVLHGSHKRREVYAFCMRELKSNRLL